MYLLYFFTKYIFLQTGHGRYRPVQHINCSMSKAPVLSFVLRAIHTRRRIVEFGEGGNEARVSRQREVDPRKGPLQIERSLVLHGRRCRDVVHDHRGVVEIILAQHGQRVVVQGVVGFGHIVENGGGDDQVDGVVQLVLEPPLKNTSYWKNVGW